jgi:predicted transcriptional regulator
MKVSDVYQKGVGYTTPEATLISAAKYIFGHRHTGIPVIHEKSKKLVGFLTEQDILSQLFPKVETLFQDYVHERDFEEMEKNIKPILIKKVKDVMCKTTFSIHIEDPLLKAESIMKIRDVSRLPVVDTHGRLLGIISKVDIFKALVSKKIRNFK